MNEIVMSWPWLDRAMFGAFVGVFVSLPLMLANLGKKLDRVIRLLEIANDRQR